MRVADYVATYFAGKGLSHVFMVTGGGSMHLNDAFGRADDLSFICFHHEQACAMAADAYARIAGKPAILNVTTGPGGINALNGVFGAYTDSQPMIVVSGQVRRETLARNFPIGLRQLGDQEVDIVGMVSGITKYATVIQDVSRIRYEVEKAFYLATTGRPGPVWLDIPGDIQGSTVEPGELEGFDPYETGNLLAVPTESGALGFGALKAEASALLQRLSTSHRPCLLIGTGMRTSGCADRLVSLAARLNIPVTTAWNAHDLITNDNPFYVGRPGTIGDRAGNFAVQNADCLIILGCRLNIRQISYNWASFAPHAFKIMVDADKAELEKPTLKIDQPIHGDLSDFLDSLDEVIATHVVPEPHRAYLAWCKARQERYPVVLEEYWQGGSSVNPYCFVSALFHELDAGDVIVTGDGTACVVTFQAANIKVGQRLFTNSGCASMGFDLPGAIGAFYALDTPKRVICIAGDGSLMMNIQELQTIVGNKLPIKIFIFNNDGYHSIRQTQENYFADNIVGCGPESGLTFPDFQKIGAAFGFPTRQVSAHADMSEAIRATLEGDGAQICEVMLDKAQPFSPKLSSRRLDDGRMVTSPMEDLAPFLSREELAENMLEPLASV